MAVEVPGEDVGVTGERGGEAAAPLMFKFRDNARMAYLAKREVSGTAHFAGGGRFRWTPER